MNETELDGVEDQPIFERAGQPAVVHVEVGPAAGIQLQRCPRIAGVRSRDLDAAEVYQRIARRVRTIQVAPGSAGARVVEHPLAAVAARNGDAVRDGDGRVVPDRASRMPHDARAATLAAASVVDRGVRVGATCHIGAVAAQVAGRVGEARGCGCYPDIDFRLCARITRQRAGLGASSFGEQSDARGGSEQCF